MSELKMLEKEEKQKPAKEALDILNQISHTLMNKKPDPKFLQSHDIINRSSTFKKKSQNEQQDLEKGHSKTDACDVVLELDEAQMAKIKEKIEGIQDGMRGRNNDKFKRKNTDASVLTRSIDRGIKKQMTIQTTDKSQDSNVDRFDQNSIDSAAMDKLFDIHGEISQAQNQELKRRQNQDEPKNSAYNQDLQHVPAIDKQNFTIERLSLENKLIYINHVLSKTKVSQKKRGASILPDQVNLSPTRRGVTQVQDKNIIDYFFDVNTETLALIRLKRLVADAILIEPLQRTQENLGHLNQYFQRFKFFVDLKKDNKGEVYLNVLRYLKLLKLDADKTLIEQGEAGDRYYFILKGEVRIRRAYAYPVKTVQLNDGELRSQTDLNIQSFLHAIDSNFNKVFWSKIPYMEEIKASINAHRQKFSGSPQKEKEMERTGAYIDTDPQLYQRLRKISKVFDFKILMLQKEVDHLGAGSQIGELALLNNEVRQATVEAKDTTLFAFLEKEEFRAVLDRAQRRDIDKKTKFLQTNRFFKDISNAKLNKMYINMRHLSIARNQSLYNEGEQVKGIYMVQSGTLRLVKKVTYEEPIAAKTNNKWFVQNAIGIGANKKKFDREVAEFHQGAFLGFEEIFRDYILSYKDPKVGNIKTNNQGLPVLIRDFSCYCYSHSAEILYLPFSLILPILKLQDKNLIELLFKERRQIIQIALSNIDSASNSISGSTLPSKSQVQQQEIDDGTLPQDPQSIEAGLSTKIYAQDSIHKINTNPQPSSGTPSQRFEISIGGEINSRHNFQNLANISLDAGSQMNDQRHAQILLQQNNSQTLVKDVTEVPEQLTHETLYGDQPTNEEREQHELVGKSLKFDQTHNSVQLPQENQNIAKHLGTEFISLGRESNNSQIMMNGLNTGQNTSRKNKLMSSFLDANLSGRGSQASDSIQSPRQELKSQFPPTQTQRHQFNIKKAQRSFMRYQKGETQTDSFQNENGVKVRNLEDTKLDLNFDGTMKNKPKKDFQIAPGAKSHKGTGHSRHAGFKTNSIYHGTNLSLPQINSPTGVNQSQEGMMNCNGMKTEATIEKDSGARKNDNNIDSHNKRPFQSKFQSNIAQNFGLNLISGECSGRESFSKRQEKKDFDQFRASEQFNPLITHSVAFSSMAANLEFGRTQQQNQSNSSMSKVMSPQDLKNSHQLFSQGGERKLEKRQVAHHNLLSSQRKQRDNQKLNFLKTEPISKLQRVKKDQDQEKQIIKIQGHDKTQENEKSDELFWQKSQAEPSFVFAQDLCQDNIIDEQSIQEQQSVRIRGLSQNTTPLFSGTFNQEQLARSPLQQTNQVSEGKAKAEDTTEEDLELSKKFVKEIGQNGDTSHLYLKDVKNFLSLRNAAFNCNQRKDLENRRKKEELAKKKANNPKAGVVSTTNGSKIQKIVYDGEKEMNSGDIVGKEMSLRLLGVMQSLETAQYYQMVQDKATGRMLKETDVEAVVRVNKSLDKNMNSIQQTFNQMDYHERVQNYKRKTKANILESPKKQLRDSVKKMASDSNKAAKVPIHFQGFKPTLKPIANEKQPVVPVGIFTSKNATYRQKKPFGKNYSERKEIKTNSISKAKPIIEEHDSFSYISNTRESKFRINVNRINNLMDRMHKQDSSPSQGSAQDTVMEGARSSLPIFKDTPCAFEQDPVDHGADSSFQRQRPSPDLNIGVIFEETERSAQPKVANNKNEKENVLLVSQGQQRQELKGQSELSLPEYNIQQINLSNKTPMEQRYGSNEMLQSDQGMKTNTVSSHLRNRDESCLDKDKAFSDITIKPQTKDDRRSSIQDCQVKSPEIDINDEQEIVQGQIKQPQVIQAYEFKVESPISYNYSKGNIGSQRSNLMKLQNIQQVQQQLLFGSGQQYFIKDNSSQFIQVRSPEMNISSAQAESIRYGGRQAESTSKQNSVPGQFSTKFGIQLSNQNLTAKNKVKLFEQLKNQTTTVQNLSQVRQTKLPKIIESPSKVLQQQKLLKKHQSAIKVPNYYGMNRQNLNINEIIAGSNDFPLHEYLISPEKSSIMGQTDQHWNTSGMQTMKNSQKQSMRNSNLK